MSDKQIEVTVKPYGATRGSVQTQIAHTLRDAGIPIIEGSDIRVSDGQLSRSNNEGDGSITFRWEV